MRPASRSAEGRWGPSSRAQDKEQERRYYAELAASSEYTLFTQETNSRIIGRMLGMSGLREGASVLDLGCGLGIFTRILRGKGIQTIGLDLTLEALLEAKRRGQGPYAAADAEAIPARTSSLEGVVLSGFLHHLPDPTQCIREIHRVLRPGGVFAAFDPNRLNPFMWLYRDPTSPLFTGNGASVNERPIAGRELKAAFESAGFHVAVDYFSAEYAYLNEMRSKPALRFLLPIYNFLELWMFKPWFLRRFRSFVLTSGVKG